MTLEELRESIRQYLSMGAEMSANMPVNPYQWLLDNGQAMGPNIALPEGVEYKELKQCYRNSVESLRKFNGWFYAEGYAASLDLGLPVQHAWLVNADGDVLDLTWRSPPGTAVYFGATFSHEYVLKTLVRTRYYGVLSNGFLWNEELFFSTDGRWKAQMLEEA